jgi:hypothetical protein
MTLKSLATLPMAFLAGVGGILVDRIFEQWAYDHAVRFTPPVNLVVYLTFFIAPFVFFVIGWDRRRWEQNYFFSQEGKAESRRLFLRWIAYFLGNVIVRYAL